MASPCIGCEHEHEDKNTDLCANCEKRIKYAEEQFMIPSEAVEADRAAREEMRKIREIKVAKPTKKKMGHKPKPPKEAVEKKRARPQKTILKAETTRKGIYLRPTEFCSEIMIEEIIQGIQEIANSQLRSLPQQVLWILKERVEEWNREKREG